MYVLIIEIYLFGLCCGFGGAGLLVGLCPIAASPTDLRIAPPWSDLTLRSESEFLLFGLLIVKS